MYRSIIRESWSAETSSVPDQWTPDNPARGQCAVTALVVQDLFGGVLLRGVVDGESHYWNRLPDGTEIDLTLEQFGGRSPSAGAIRERSYVLSFPDIARRYELLRVAVGKRLRLAML